jgi:hypothetical protein
MRIIVPTIAAALTLCASVAWAQNPATVVAPVTTPQTTGSTAQGTSDAVKAGTAAPTAPADSKTAPTPAPQGGKK